MLYFDEELKVSLEILSKTDIQKYLELQLLEADFSYKLKLLVMEGSGINYPLDVQC